MSDSTDLTTRILVRLKKRFYEGHEKLYFQELRMLKQAIATPARWLDDRGVSLPVEKYESLLLTILRTIIEHGDFAKVRSPGRYFLHAVQEHMKHHGEEYYEAGKTFRTAIEETLQNLRKRAAKPVLADATVATLAAVHKVLTSKSGRERKLKTATEKQQSFFEILSGQAVGSPVSSYQAGERKNEC